MKNLKKLFFLAFFLGFSTMVYAQNGTIRGTVIDDATGESLIGVNVLVKGTSDGASTDMDGQFDLNLSAGTYNIRLSYVSYQTVMIEDVEVKAGEVTLLNNIRMKPTTQQMEEVVVSAGIVKSSETALLTVKRKSSSFIDGISAGRVGNIGVSNAADALKKVTGVSIQGGKYVYVRGLGDRYTNTMLNSVEIPSLDPNRNSLQIDIFPTNLIDNMVINKTAVAELPADFTGGIVNIQTKDFPDKPIFDISISGDYNPDMHFNNNFLTNSGSETDFLGFDSGERELPNRARDEKIPTPLNDASDEEVYNFVNSFNPKLSPNKTSKFTDYSLGLSLGNQFNVGKEDNKLGYIFSATYKNSKTHFDNFRYGEYQTQADPTAYDLVYATKQNGVVSNNEILLGGLAGVAFKTSKSKYKLTGLHLQNGERKATNFFVDNSGTAVGQSGYLGDSYNLEYGERRITNVLLNGTHYFDKSKWKIDWRLSPTLSSMDDPDIRRTTYTLRGSPEDPTYTFNAGAGGYPSRQWRYMDEVNLVGRANITREYNLFGETAKLKFGGSHVYKQRDYEILTYGIQFFPNQPNEWSGDPSDILDDENIYGNGNGNGFIYYISGNPTPNPNAYSSNINNTALYISNEFNPLSDLKVNLGIRAEKFVQRHTGRDVVAAQTDGRSGKNLDNEKVLDALDFFPSANLTYFLSENQNLRFSYSRTIARPSFKELSFAQILDPISNRIFNGGLFEIGEWDGNLSETRINNFDFRWERYFDRGQLLSASLFYKTFTDPIELVRIQVAATSAEFQPRNVGNGQVYGAEFEFRKSLGFLSSSLANLSVSSNVTLVKSIIDMTPQEFEARKRREKEGQNVDDQRAMAGQAPYIVNSGLRYDNPDKGFDAGLFYNVKGETLTIVGGGLFPDVYSDPFHNLKFNLNKSFGADDQYSVNLSVTNILNERRGEYYKGYRTSEQVFETYNPHRTVSVGFKYSVK